MPLLSALSRSIFDGWTPVSPASFPLFRRYELQDPCRLPGHGATSLVSWSFPGNGLYKEISGCLCSAWFYEPYPLFFLIHAPQDAPGFAQAVDALFGLSRQAGQDFLEIAYADERLASMLQELPGYAMERECNRDGSSYVYRPQDLLALEGKVNSNKRHAVNMMARLGEVSVRELHGTDIDLCLRIEKMWCQGRDCAECSKWVVGKCGQKALERLLSFFDPEVHRAFALYSHSTSAGERPVGYLIAEPTRKGVVYMHYGKGIENSALPYLLMRVTQEHFANYELIDYGEDMGNPALRTAKGRLGAFDLLLCCECVLRRK